MFDNIKKIFSGPPSAGIGEGEEPELIPDKESTDSIATDCQDTQSDIEDSEKTLEEESVEEKSPEEELPETKMVEENDVEKNDAEESGQQEEYALLTDEQSELLSIVGNLDAEDLKRLLERGAAFDEAVNQARIEGERRGRCERIEEYIANGKPEGDGIPRLASNPGCGRRTMTSIFDLAREA